ncbi:response regulator [Vibrio cholerae]|jgi:CheY-like chemotaxis protein
MKNVLIVEDNNFKRMKIREHIEINAEEILIYEACSFTSAWQCILDHSYDLIILDMSLPTFDVSDVESGGTFRALGGRELAKKMYRRKINTPFVIMTHYKNFSDDINTYTFDTLKEEMLNSFPNQCISFIYFSSNSSDWRVNLDEVIKL